MDQHPFTPAKPSLPPEKERQPSHVVIEQPRPAHRQMTGPDGQLIDVVLPDPVPLESEPADRRKRAAQAEPDA